MTPTSKPEYDKDFLILSEINSNREVSQRELSHKTGLSLGSVNLLIQKMIRKGLLKMEMIPTNRVIYMLTPKGLAEKTAKTVRYVQLHYTAIQETKAMIKKKLNQYESKFEQIIVCQPESELKDLVRATLNEYMHENPQVNVIMMNRQELDRIKRYNPKTIILYLPEKATKFSPEIAARGYETDLLI
ncbi:MAG: winged helix-turn-helix transcriptional regulator [Saccharofermentanales bacterium]